MAEGKLHTAGNFAALEAALCEELRSLRHLPPGAVWVLVPNNLAARHLRRVVAGAAGGVCGVEFLLLKDAAARLVLPHMAAGGLRPASPGAEMLAMRRLLNEVADDSYFAGMRHFLNAAPAVLEALEDLRESLWSPEALRRAAGTAEFEDLDAPRRLQELADLWSSLRRWKRNAGLFSDNDLIREAGRRDLTPTECPVALLIYGFYDLTPAQDALVGRLISLAQQSKAFMLWAGTAQEPAPGFEYALPTLRRLCELMECAAPTSVAAERAGEPTQLAALRDGLFAPQPIADEEEQKRRLAEPADGTVTVLSCPGEEPEAAETVRQVLRTMQHAAPSEAPPRVGVLLRGAEGTVELLEETLDRAGIVPFAHEGMPLADTPAGRVALTLLDLAAGDARRGDVINFLGLAHIKMPEGLSATALDRVSREAGIIKGNAAWVPLLRARAERLTEEARHADSEAEEHGGIRRAELCQTAAGFLEDFFGRLESLPQESWRAAADWLDQMVARWAPDDEGRRRVLACIGRLGELDICGLPPTVRRVRWLLGRILARKSRQLGGFQRTPLSVCTLMGARGVSFDVVIVPGLVEKSFPAHTGEQPLLTELDREALNTAAEGPGCGELPLPSRRPEEERYLFRLAVGAASGALVLTYPRLEQDKGRPRMPSRFLGEVASCLAGCMVPASALERRFSAGWFRWVPLNRPGWQDEEPALALDEAEYDEAVFCSGRRLATAYMAQVSRGFARALRMEKERWHGEEFGPFDGCILDRDLLGTLRERHGRFERPVAPTRFEAYAACPFQYFMKYVLRVEQVEEPAEELMLSPLDRGSLVHDVLSRLYEQCLGKIPLGRRDDEDLEQALGAAEKLLDELGAAHARNRPAPWTAEKEGILTELESALAHDREAHGDGTPERFEYSFQRRLRLEGVDASFRGRVDRVDRRPDGGVRVVDYKTGSSSRYEADTFRGGRQLQLPLYLLATAEELGAEDGEALYFFLKKPQDVPQFTLGTLRERLDELRRILGLIIEGISGGAFFPLPADLPARYNHCGRYCAYSSVCGPARGDLASFKGAGPRAAPLRELRSIE